MKRVVYILFLLGLYLILSSRSCSDDKGQALRLEEEVSAAKDSIRSEFEAGYLSEDARFAAELKAIQELEDLADYINIYTDNSLDSVFRQKAGEMIRDVFIADCSRLSFVMVRSEKMKPIQLGDFLENDLADVTDLVVVFDSVSVVEPLRKTGALSYFGSLGCVQKVISVNGIDTISTPPEIITIEMIVTREEKIFGTDTIQVWSVSLGDMVRTE